MHQEWRRSRTVSWCALSGSFFSTDIFTSGKAHQQRFAGISDLENGDICSSRISSREDGDVDKKVSPKSDPQKWGIHFEVTHSKGFPKVEKYCRGFLYSEKKDICPLSLFIDQNQF